MQKTQAEIDVLAERERQKSEEGWTPERDDVVHAKGELAKAAASYALVSTLGPRNDPEFRRKTWFGTSFWPWSHTWWKPTTPRRDLVKAGALILAEIERLDRQAAMEGKTDE